MRPVWFRPGTFSEKLKAGIELFYTFFDEDPMAFCFILLAQHDFPAGRKLKPDLSPENLVFYFIREWMKTGAFAVQDAELGAAMVLGLVLEPAVLHAKGKLKGSMASRVEAITEACLKVLKGKSKKAQRTK